MPTVAVESLDDPRLDSYRELQRSRRGVDEFIVEGEWLVERLLASRYPVKSLVVVEARLEAWRDRLSRLPDEVPVFVLSAERASELVGFAFHRGVLGCGARLPETPVESLGAGSSERATLVVCPQTFDPENLGSLLRTAAALGAGGVLLGETCVDAFSRRALRVSMGAALQLPLRKSQRLLDDLDALERSGFQLTAAVVDPEAEPLDEFQPAPRTALLVGNEAHGLAPEFLARCARHVSIPMADGVDSLNVAVATGILLYRFLSVGR